MIIAAEHLRLMRKVQEELGDDGWAKVRSDDYVLVTKIPNELMHKRVDKEGARCRLTHDGEVVLKFADAIIQGAKA